MYIIQKRDKSQEKAGGFILPRNLFYTTDISVTLWIVNKNKKARVVMQNGKPKAYRDRSNEILFMDLRQMGSPYEKKFIELTDEDRAKVAATYHAWQSANATEEYKDIDEYCYSAKVFTKDLTEEQIKNGDKSVEGNNYSLVPSKYIKFINNDENVDYDTKMKQLQAELTDLLKEEEQSKADLLEVFKELGYEIKL